MLTMAFLFRGEYLTKSTKPGHYIIYQWKSLPLDDVDWGHVLPACCQFSSPDAKRPYAGGQYLPTGGSSNPRQGPGGL